jgi:hypothetical protein
MGLEIASKVLLEAACCCERQPRPWCSTGLPGRRRLATSWPSACRRLAIHAVTFDYLTHSASAARPLMIGRRMNLAYLGFDLMIIGFDPLLAPWHTLGIFNPSAITASCFRLSQAV